MAPVPLIAVTLALVYRQGTILDKPSDVAEVPKVSVIVPIVMYASEGSFLTSITIVADPDPALVVPEAE